MRKHEKQTRGRSRRRVGRDRVPKGESEGGQQERKEILEVKKKM